MIQKPYERQLAREQIPQNCRVFIGEDVFTTWDSRADRALLMYLYAERRLPLVPTRGQAIGAQGETIEWERPALVARTSDWIVRDYDNAILDQLTDWQHGGDALRLWVPGYFWLRCRVNDFKLNAPLRQQFTLTTLNRQLYIYKRSLGCDMWNDSAAHQSSNNPFLTGDDYGYTYGSVT